MEGGGVARGFILRHRVRMLTSPWGLLSARPSPHPTPHPNPPGTPGLGKGTGVRGALGTDVIQPGAIAGASFLSQ